MQRNLYSFARAAVEMFSNRRFGMLSFSKHMELGLWLQV
jgi:hypothetical protein